MNDVPTLYSNADSSSVKPVPDLDGTSQSNRSLAALKADYAPLDERSLKDFLALAQQFSQELNYFNADNAKAGNWSRFINPDDLPESEFSAWIEHIEGFVAQPENFPEERYPDLRRPHFVLFLTFLQLLKNTQAQLNGITDRHLDFYYRDVLKFVPKQAQPDRVNLLLSVTAEDSPVLVPKGTLLAAGKDSSGKDLAYRTDNDLVVNRAQVAQLSGVYVNKEIIGFPESRAAISGTRNKLMAMLRLALGEPEPGGDLPAYPFAAKVKPMDDNFLARLQKLLDFAGKDGLFMEIAELRELIMLKNNRGPSADDDWRLINSIFLNAAQKQRHDGNFQLTLTNPRDFDNNLITALQIKKIPNDQAVDIAKTMAAFFDTLPLVDTIDELYQQRERGDVLSFIASRMYMDLVDFDRLMQIKLRIDDDWRRIYSILTKAGRRKAKDSVLSAFSPPNFDASFTSVLDSPKFSDFDDISDAINNLDSFYAALLDIEAYFYMPLESFRKLPKVADKDPPSDEDWLQMDGIFAVTHQNKVFAERMLQLRPSKQPVNPETDLAAMMRLSLGLPTTDTDTNSQLLAQIKTYLPVGTDLSLFDKTDTYTDQELASVINKLAIAWRNRVPISPPRIVNWRTLTAYDDVTVVPDLKTQYMKYWYTFGQRKARRYADSTKPPPAVQLGWAMSSPLLRAGEGERKINIGILFKPDGFDYKKLTDLFKDSKNQPFTVEFSTAKGWQSPDIIETKVVELVRDDIKWNIHSIIWRTTISDTADAVAPLENNSEGGIQTNWPVLRLLLQPRWNGAFFETNYSAFKGLVIEEVILTVQVSGLKNCALQNDEQKIQPGKPFEPFGINPVTGSRLYFSHPELLPNPLDSLKITLNWIGLPDSNLSKYYQNYELPADDGKTVPIKNDSFKTIIGMYDQNQDVVLLGNSNLFDTDAKNTVSLQVVEIKSNLQKPKTDYVYKRLSIFDEQENLKEDARYFFLELIGCDFQHSAYPGLAAKMSIQLANDIANKKPDLKAENYQVNPPFAPKLKGFSVDYATSLILKEADFPLLTEDCFYHLHPFGYAPLAFDKDSGGYRFLPNYDNEGELYIGLNGVDAPQVVTLLLQLAEGSANPDLTPAKIEWSVLDGNRWQPLRNGQLIEDGSNGLLQSGIITFALEPVAPSTLLPSSAYWLRAAIKQGCDSVCDSVGINAQAVSATFFDQDNADDHLSQPLPANTITALLKPLAGISLAQPYTSFGGRPKEEDTHFSTRVSERLRHKQRALTIWDYERLVLEQFPEIYKVKCLPSGESSTLQHVKVIVIPDIRNRLPFNPFEPKASSSLLAEIEAFLQGRAPLGVEVKVGSARYLPVKLRLDVGLCAGCDSGFYLNRLNEDINRFLSPWAYEDGKDIVIGGKIYATAIIDYIDRLGYVASVQNLTLFLCDEDGENPRLIPKPDLNIKTEGYAVFAGQPDAVLVAAKVHEIGLVNDLNFSEHAFNGINYMKIGLDFIVA